MLHNWQRVYCKLDKRASASTTPAQSAKLERLAGSDQISMCWNVSHNEKDLIAGWTAHHQYGQIRV